MTHDNVTDIDDLIEEYREYLLDTDFDQYGFTIKRQNLRLLIETLATLRKQLSDARDALRPFAEKSEQAMQGYSSDWAERMGPDYPVFGWNGPVFTLRDFLNAQEALKGQP